MEKGTMMFYFLVVMTDICEEADSGAEVVMREPKELSSGKLIWNCNSTTK